MNDSVLLNMLKVDLGITSTAYDERLSQYLENAKAQIVREGVSDLDTSSSLDDAQLVIMYAAWTWNKRDSDGAMPRMLRWSLNNRVFGLKARG